MNDAEIEALEAQYRKAVYPSHVPGAYNIVFDSNLIEKGVRKLLDEVKLLNLQNDEIREGEACDRQVMDEFAREFFGDQEGTLWLPGLTLKKLLEMVRDRFVEKRKDATQ